MRVFRIGFLGLACLAGAACSTAPQLKEVSPQELLTAACAPGKQIQSVRGSIWMKAKSPDASGQFPANVIATSPDQLQLEVTNLLGGTEAWVSVQGTHYEVSRPGKPNEKQEGRGTWAGIPLRWATDLFLGRIPCPTDLAKTEVRVNSDKELVLFVPQKLGEDPQEFIYRFREWDGKPWPEALRWRRLGAPIVSVEFKFDKPESETGSPKKWEARSNQGEVKVRWSNRNVSH